MITTSDEQEEDISLDTTLRPQRLSEYVGQQKIRKNLQMFIDAAKKRGESIEHVLLYGPAGLGKTTLAHIIAHEMGVNIKVTSCYRKSRRSRFNFDESARWRCAVY